MLSGIGNLLTGGTNQKPPYNPVYLDPGTESVINQEAAQGNQSQAQITANELNGTNPTLGNVTGAGTAVGYQQAALGGDADPNVAAALNNRASRMYDAQYNQLAQQAKFNAPAIQGQLASQAANSLQANQNIENQINTNQLDAITKQNMIRQQVIGSLFGGAGSFAGGYLGNNGGAFGNNNNGSNNSSDSPSTFSYNSGNTDLGGSTGNGQGLGRTFV